MWTGDKLSCLVYLLDTLYSAPRVQAAALICSLRVFFASLLDSRSTLTPEGWIKSTNLVEEDCKATPSSQVPAAEMCQSSEKEAEVPLCMLCCVLEA